MKRTIAVLAALGILSACGDPRPLSVDRQDYRAALLDNANAAQLIPTPEEDIPSGRATYEGQFTSGALINDSSGYDLIGDVALTADFGSSRRTSVTGEIENINLIDRFNADRENSQELRGSLDVEGLSTGGQFNANATGELEAVFNNDGFLRSTDVDLDLAGIVVTDRDDGDTIYGIVDGEGRGDFDLLLTGDGEFSATLD